MPRTHMVDAILREIPNGTVKIVAGVVEGVYGATPDVTLDIRMSGQLVTGVRATGDGVDVGDQVWVLSSGTLLVAVIGGSASVGGDYVRLKGSVPTEADLPPGPHEHGDAWIVSDTGHLWVWIDPPGEFQDGGQFITTSHDDLTNVRSDQHHTRYTDTEAVTAVGPHFPGGHDDLSGITADQHHVRYTDQEAVDAVNGLYLPLGGGTLTGPLTLHADPANPLESATKQYVDAQGGGGGTPHLIQDTEPASPVTGTVWVDPSEPGAGDFLPLSGGTMTGPLVLAADPADPLDAATKQYVDSLPPSFSGDHDDLTNVLPDQHHVRYTDAEAVTAVGPHFSGDHADLTNVLPDQHHAELHTLDSHTDVAASNPSYGMAITWNGTEWIAARVAGGSIGLVAFDYLFDADMDGVPERGHIEYDNADPIAVTVVNVDTFDENGDDISLFIDQLAPGDRINLHDPVDAQNHRHTFDVTGAPTLTGEVWNIPVANTDVYGPVFADQQQVRLFIQYVPPPSFSGNHADLSGVEANQHHPQAHAHDGADGSGTVAHASLTGIGVDDHHARYTDAEAVTAVGPHFSGDHADLTNILPDQHHTRYTDQEAIDATDGAYLPLTGGTLTGALTLSADPANPLEAATKQYVDSQGGGGGTPHLIQGTEPASPVTGTVWVNPDEPGPEDFLPLAGGTMLGTLDMGANVISNVVQINGTQDTGMTAPDGGTIMFQLGAEARIYITETSTEFFNPLDMKDRSITGVSDPVDDAEVGSRGYNDGRYLSLTGGDLTGNLRLMNGSLIEWQNDSGGDAYSTKYYDATGEFSVWSVPAGERVIRFFDDGRIQLRPAASAGAVMELFSDHTVLGMPIRIGGTFSATTDITDSLGALLPIGTTANATGIYFGPEPGTDGHGANGAIESGWLDGNHPALEIGLTRDLTNGSIRFLYSGISELRYQGIPVALWGGGGLVNKNATADGGFMRNIYTGTDVPDPALGNVGDVYIRRSS